MSLISSSPGFICGIPRQIPSLQCWLDAADPAGNGTQPATGSAFATWVDKSGRSNHFTQAVGVSQPLFITGVQNNLPGIRFDGTNDSMNRDALSSIMNGTDKAITVFAVCIPRNIAATKALWSTANGGALNTANAMLMHRITGGNAWSLLKRDNVPATKFDTAGAFALANPYISVMRVNAGGTTADLTINTTKIMNAVDIDVGVCTITNFYLGALVGSNGGTQFWNGDILEFFILDGAATDAQITIGKNYLSQKWGIAV